LPTLVYSLENAPEDAALVGGKAAGLGLLARAGLPVPAGFVLTARAFRSFLGWNGMEGELDALSAGEPDAAEPAVLSRLHAARWPDELRSAIETAYATLRQRTDDVPVAARSSATVEDSARASFAGQHATMLNLRGFDALLDGILACWASLYNAAALHYRRHRAVEDGGPAMAVIVQALVPAEASGVAFTLDPVTGDCHAVLIEGVWGLGEGLVGGMLDPDRFSVRKSDSAIVRREVARKRLRVVPAAGGGTETEELSTEHACRPALTDDQAVELAHFAVRIEELLGRPADIEWALAQGRFSVLQARPVTAAGPPPAIPEDGWVSEFDSETDPETVWTAANIQEVLPDQLSPFGCSLTKGMLERYGREPMRRMGIRLRTKDQFSAYFYGRGFLNVTMMVEVADEVPFGSPETVAEEFLGRDCDRIAVATPLSLGKLFRYALVTPRILWFSARMPAEIRRAERIIDTLEREEAARPFAGRTDEELIRALEEGIENVAIVAVIHISGSGVTSSSFEWLGRLTERWLGDENRALQNALCTGLADMASARPAYDLWDLSRFVLESEPLRQAFEPQDPTEIERRLVALPDAEQAAFRQRLDQFLARHGHRSVMEGESAAKSWDEDLPTVYAMLRNYLRANESSDPRRIEERQRRERERITEESLSRLRRWQRPLLRRAVAQAQEWVVLREHTKSLLVRGSHRGRRLTRELARRMVARGLLTDLWDFYYLTWDEAKALLRGELARDEACAQIVRRKAEQERNRQVVLPESFKGRPKPLRPEDVPLPEGRVLQGLPVSPGRVTGPARVILDPRRDAAIEPGEILVAPVTDAGWTPLFVAASGIVVDVGGSLSHGSTVAREYGLPAVVNVKHGTRLIRTGQTVTVDGAQGVVILEE
jgi:phosphohistidine swiveling domain-containing protein